MKRFQFRLERLLRLKEQRKRQAELAQAQARQALDRARAEVASLLGQLAAAAEECARRVGRPLPAGEWLLRQDHVGRLRAALDAAEEGVRQAERNLAEADARRARAALEVEALTRLRQRQWEAWRRDADRAEQGQADELGMRRWQAGAEALAGGQSP
ncbi:MAG TPA: flagellar export protein FliJ [Gemmataceae bacterium]|nr:flagellar export protein FliJ [Gemmataceae bacterium]